MFWSSCLLIICQNHLFLLNVMYVCIVLHILFVTKVSKGAFTPAEHYFWTLFAMNKKCGSCKHSPASNRVCKPCFRMFSSVPLLVGKLANAQSDSVFVTNPVWTAYAERTWAAIVVEWINFYCFHLNLLLFSVLFSKWIGTPKNALS